MSKLQDAFFITVITLMLVGTLAINKAQAANLKEDVVKTTSHKATFAQSYKVRGKTYQPMKSVAYFSQTGKASWYGPGFHGKKTSNGERFDMHGLTAAHRTLPLGTQVRVTNVSNGKSVIVRVNDRGPFHGNRVIDLSKGAANKLGFVQHGMATVKLETLNGKPNTPDTIDVLVAETPKINTLAKQPSIKLPETTQPEIKFAGSQSRPYLEFASNTLFWNVQNFENEHDARRFMLKTSDQLRQANANYPVDMIKQNNGYAVRVGPFENLQNLNNAKSQFANLQLSKL